MYRKLESFLPYALPVLGGFLGIVWVNINAFTYINPVAAIVVGSVAGWAVSKLVLKLMSKRR